MLGVEISRDRDAGTITIRQASKAKSLATAFRVEGERCVTPMTPVVYGELQAAREGDDMADTKAYQSGIGSLLLMVQCKRPDIASHWLHFARPRLRNTMWRCSMLSVTLAALRIAVSPTTTQVCPWRCGAMRILQHVSICGAVCLDEWFGGAVSWESCK
jgi:hypothetical protein